jgi:hypothetical protein
MGDSRERSRLKLAINMAAMLGSSKALKKNGRLFLLAKVEINNGQRKT